MIVNAPKLGLNGFCSNCKRNETTGKRCRNPIIEFEGFGNPGGGIMQPQGGFCPFHRQIWQAGDFLLVKVDAKCDLSDINRYDALPTYWGKMGTSDRD
jgi:hypothetical protein